MTEEEREEPTGDRPGPAAAEGLQRALQELIDIGRAALDVAEELVRDPATTTAVADAVRSVAGAVGRNGSRVVEDLRRAAATRSPGTGPSSTPPPEGPEGPSGDDPDGGYHRIPVG